MKKNNLELESSIFLPSSVSLLSRVLQYGAVVVKNAAKRLLPVRSMREGYAFVSVYMCVCVWTKNTLVYVSPLEIRHKSALCSFFTEFIVL